jgi:hypothetical protein
MNESDIVVKMCFKERKEEVMLRHSEGNVSYDLVVAWKNKRFPVSAGELSGEGRYEGCLVTKMSGSREILLWKVVKCILKKG